MPTLLSAEPTAVKSVFPTVKILYLTPTINPSLAFLKPMSSAPFMPNVEKCEPVSQASAVPVPVPAPVATNIVLLLLSAAPICVKSVVPALVILYELPVTKLPAVTLLSVILPSLSTKSVLSMLSLNMFFWFGVWNCKTLIHS